VCATAVAAGRCTHAELTSGLAEGMFWLAVTAVACTPAVYANTVVLVCTQREQLKTLYQPGDGSDQAANREALDKVSGDRAFTCPTIELTEAFDGAGVRTYFYHLTHRASNEVWPPWMGVIHGAEIQVRSIIQVSVFSKAMVITIRYDTEIALKN